MALVGERGKWTGDTSQAEKEDERVGIQDVQEVRPGDVLQEASHPQAARYDCAHFLRSVYVGAHSKYLTLALDLTGPHCFRHISDFPPGTHLKPR